MSVYTVLNRGEVAAFAAGFGLGELLSFEGIKGGSDNSSYYVVTSQSCPEDETENAEPNHFVLTVFESIPPETLAPFVALTHMLHSRGLPVPCPIAGPGGDRIHRIHQHSAVLTPKINGEAPGRADPAQCGAMGSALGYIHRATLDSDLQLQGRDLDWLTAKADALARQLPAERPLLAEIRRFRQLATQNPALPQAIIHGDLFRDNTLFEGDQLRAIIDFNTAHRSYLLLDLAIAANDWCSDGEGRLRPELVRPLVESYDRVRPLAEGEARMWNDFLRLAAARLWVSRLVATHAAGSPGADAGFRDPLQYRAILQRRIDEPQTLASLG